MSTYTRRSPRDLEDSAARHGTGAGFSVRFARESRRCEATGLARRSLALGARAPVAHPF